MDSLADLDEKLIITGRVLSSSAYVGDVDVKIQMVNKAWSDGSADFHHTLFEVFSILFCQSVQPQVPSSLEPLCLIHLVLQLCEPLLMIGDRVASAFTS